MLYDPKTNTVYTPNTNQTAVMGKLQLGGAKGTEDEPLQERANGGMIEDRSNPYHDAAGRFTTAGGVGAGSASREDLSKTEERVREAASKSAAELVEKAKSGGVNSGIYKQAKEKGRFQLAKSIRGHSAQVSEHQDKLNHPEKYDSGWGEKNAEQRQFLLNKWEKDMVRNVEQMTIEEYVYKEKFGNG